MTADDYAPADSSAGVFFNSAGDVTPPETTGKIRAALGTGEVSLTTFASRQYSHPSRDQKQDYGVGTRAYATLRKTRRTLTNRAKYEVIDHDCTLGPALQVVGLVGGSGFAA